MNTTPTTSYSSSSTTTTTTTTASFSFPSVGNILDNQGLSAGQSTVAQTELAIEQEIIRMISIGDIATLKPNSGQSVSFRSYTSGEHYVCVSFEDKPLEGIREWQWHGHVGMYDLDTGFTIEHIYGDYVERLSMIWSREYGESEVRRLNEVGVNRLLGMKDRPGFSRFY